MFKYVVLLGALALAAPSLAIADDNQPPPSLTDLTANDPPASSFNTSAHVPPGLGGPPPGCNILAMDKDDQNHPNGNGDDKKSSPGNPNCQPASP